MWKFIAKRLLQAIPLLLIISFIVFSLIQLAPFDVVDTLTTPNMTQEQIDLLREKNGLNDPFLIQYGHWLLNVLHFDFGHSLKTQSLISQDLAVKLPNTLMIVVPAYFSSLLLASVLGLWAAANKDRFPDKLVNAIASIGMGTPTFWFGMLLIYLFGYKLNLLPIVGMYSTGQSGSLADLLRHIILPYLTLIIAYFPELLRYIRAAAIEQVKEDYVTVQRAYHASKSEIVFRHVLRNIWIPIVTRLGQALPMFVTGAIITENIFGWPGIGTYLTSATNDLDYPVIMAVLLISSTLVILGNLLSDVLYSIVDPRIRKAG
ncbi:ABC transporter permease [Streptococcus loxodontisalivarius]|uniref:Peptide/nickel transport system permease protein n=1 Tax=Streptococcus loxodontisalivarius TaxID=1349415 RepID=A0ABS2PSJ9_9STRE|nr:ABC transporter permease [Streptococcus loxodontisalivarius]MBM7642908.1 peptide/nickel transport system permease protein [Streptococcus loxodontisalivarius]